MNQRSCRWRELFINSPSCKESVSVSCINVERVETGKCKICTQFSTVYFVKFDSVKVTFPLHFCLLFDLSIVFILIPNAM